MHSSFNLKSLSRRQVLASGAASVISPWGFAQRVADHMAKTFKQPFVIDNMAGTNGILGNDVVAKAPADGYTLLFTYAAAVSV